MRLPFRPIVKKGAKRTDGTSLIFIQYCLSIKQRTLVSTGISIPPDYWNRRSMSISKNLPIKYGNAVKLQEQVLEKLRRAEAIVDHAVNVKKVSPMKFLKENFNLGGAWQVGQMQTDRQTLDVYGQIDFYLKEKELFVKKCTLNVINAMKSHLKLFEEHRGIKITFDSFDYTFYEDFVRYLTYEIPQVRFKQIKKGLRINTVGKTVKHLKSFLKNRMLKKIIPSLDISAFKVMEEEVDAIYLSWSEISKMYHLDLSKTPHLEKYRDLFVLGSLTGFRFSDYSDIKPEEIRGDMLFVTQSKTLATVVVPLRSDARKILEKYNMHMPQVSNPDFNYYIKEVAKLAGLTENIKITHKRGNQVIEEIRPKYNWVMSHTCRRSFCTNEFLAGTPADLIMAISGHRTEKAFRRYIKADKVQKAQMIKKLWENRPSL